MAILYRELEWDSGATIRNDPCSFKRPGSLRLDQSIANGWLDRINDSQHYRIESLLQLNRVSVERCRDAE